MNKVYVVLHNVPYEDTLIRGIFTTEAGARKLKLKLQKLAFNEYLENEYFIVEVELDKEYEDIK